MRRVSFKNKSPLSLGGVLTMLMFLYLNKTLTGDKNKTNQEVSSLNFQLALVHLMHL